MLTLLFEAHIAKQRFLGDNTRLRFFFRKGDILEESAFISIFMP